MGFKEVMAKFMGNESVDKERFEEMQREQRLRNKLIERTKNSDERELKNFLEKERKKQIKEQIKSI